MNSKTETMRPGVTPDITHDLAELEIMDICAEHRDGDGVRSMVYLRNQGQVIDIDTCRTPELLASAVAHLERELEETRRALEKARRRAAGVS